MRNSCVVIAAPASLSGLFWRASRSFKFNTRSKSNCFTFKFSAAISFTTYVHCAAQLRLWKHLARCCERIIVWEFSCLRSNLFRVKHSAGSGLGTHHGSLNPEYWLLHHSQRILILRFRTTTYTESSRERGDCSPRATTSLRIFLHTVPTLVQAKKSLAVFLSFNITAMSATTAICAGSTSSSEVAKSVIITVGGLPPCVIFILCILILLNTLIQRDIELMAQLRPKSRVHVLRSSSWNFLKLTDSWLWFTENRSIFVAN